MARALNLGGLRLPLEVISACTTIVGQRGTGKTSTAVVVVEEAARVGAQYVVLDPTGAWWGLTSNAAGDGPGLDCVVMGGRHGDVPLDEHAGREAARLVAEEGYNLVLDLDRLRSWGARQRFTADFCSELYERAHSQIYVVMDEAHRLAPQNRLDNEYAARCLGAVSDLALLGRRRGVSTLLVCQRPAKLNKDVLEASEVLIAHRVRGNNDRAQLRGWIEDNDLDGRALLAELSGLAKGTAHISAPTFDINGTFAIRPKTTFDSSRSLGVREVEVQPKVRSEVDMDALRERMASTIERAAADDPRTLRARIRELERERAARPTEQVEVEVEVIPPGLRRQIAGRADAIDRLSGQFARDMADHAKGLRGLIEEEVKEGAVAEGRQPVREAARVIARPVHTRPEPRPGAGPDGNLTPARQRILDALARLEAIGASPAPKAQVAFFAEQSPKSSAFTNNLGGLRTAGLIDYPTGGMVVLTDQGRRHAQHVDAPTTVEQMWDSVQRLVQPAQWRIIKPLLDIYPHATSKADLADAAQQSATSSAFTNNLGRLRTLGLIDYPDRGFVAATPILFLERA